MKTQLLVSVLPMKKEVNSPSLTPGQSTDAPKDHRIAVVKYLLIAPDGSGDAASPTSYSSVCEEMLQQSDLEPLLLKAMDRDGVDLCDELDVSDWLIEHAEKIAQSVGYKVIKALEWRKS